MDSFVKKTQAFTKVHEVDDAEKIIKMNKNTFEAWSTIILTRVSSKRKYRKLKGGFSIQYVIKNHQYLKNSIKQWILGVK